MSSNNNDGNSKPKVDHTYRDLSRYLQRGGEVAKHKKSGSNFPAKLHLMLSEHEFSRIILWMVRFKPPFLQYFFLLIINTYYCFIWIDSRMAEPLRLGTKIYLHRGLCQNTLARQSSNPLQGNSQAGVSKDCIGLALTSIAIIMNVFFVTYLC